MATQRCALAPVAVSPDVVDMNYLCSADFPVDVWLINDINPEFTVDPQSRKIQNLVFRAPGKKGKYYSASYPFELNEETEGVLRAF